MAGSHTAVRPDPSFRGAVEDALGDAISPCFHCSKCSSGCPVTFAMDLLPNRVVRMVQMGLRDEVLGSSAIWLCASCETCSTRCPNEVDIAGLMDVLRQMAVQDGVPLAETDIPAFHDAFLSDVKRRGRVHELAMLAKYKLSILKSGDVMKDAGLGVEMFKKGKLRLSAPKVRRRAEVREIFRRSAH